MNDRCADSEGIDSRTYSPTGLPVLASSDPPKPLDARVRMARKLFELFESPLLVLGPVMCPRSARSKLSLASGVMSSLFRRWTNACDQTSESSAGGAHAVRLGKAVSTFGVVLNQINRFPPLDAVGQTADPVRFARFSPLLDGEQAVGRPCHLLPSNC